MQPDYISRMLDHGEGLVAEEDLIGRHKVIVVLAEPGAGKTDLLHSLAERLGVQPCRASLFRHRSMSAVLGALVVDALDEVARTSQAAIDEVIVKAAETRAATVIFSSRSSEWDKARTQLVKECFGQEPIIIRLQPFTEEEQQLIFQTHLPGEDFQSFRSEAARFELLPLLGNPQFLKLFADAYVQGGRRFASKKQIFVDAVERLASERSTSEWQRDRPSIGTIVALADEIFAKLLLSGASGVSMVDERDADFPYLNALSASDPVRLRFALNTRLFKPATESSHHEPVHRIVAEYCAARHLTRRLSEPGAALSLQRLMSVIAPNGTVRDELRGLLGWMAALGEVGLQEACIRADPYAVLANGDPSQLTTISKRLLLKGLKELAEIDPYFRRSDAWRRFSVAGFFSQDMAGELRELLGSGNETHAQLRDLILELLAGSDVTPLLSGALQSLTLDKNADAYTRIRAQRLLIDTEGYDLRAGISALIANGDSASLRLALETVEDCGASAVGMPLIHALLKEAGLKGKRNIYRSDDDTDTRYQISYHTKLLIDRLNLPETVSALDYLTHDLTCTCGKNSSYTCECLPGPSRVIGVLLDRYFELASPPHSPPQIWGWTRRLVFSDHRSKDSKAIQALREDGDLRRAIHRLAFAGQTDDQQLWNIQMELSSVSRHAGIQIYYDDILAINTHALETVNIPLWKSFYHRHNHHSEKRGPNPYRALLRAQVRQNAELLRFWSKSERDVRAMIKRDRKSWAGRNRRWQEREKQRKEGLREFFRENKAQIEAGGHWGAVRRIADWYLINPEEMAEYIDDPRTASLALRNCFPMLDQYVPSMTDLASNRSQVTRVLHAACLATYREAGNLNEISAKVLRAVKTDAGGYNGVSKEEAESFEAEIDRLLFPTASDAENFARELIEPQLLKPSDAPTDVSWLRYKDAFQFLRPSLPLEWLNRYLDMPSHARDTLFDICAVHGDRDQLNRLIGLRCPNIPEGTETIGTVSPDQAFWLLRAFFFLPHPPAAVWDYLKSDPQTIFGIEHRAGRFGRDDAAGWPTLSAEKVYRILDIYVDAWPKVYLPSSHGTGSPPGENAYRFLTEIIYTIGRDDPAHSVPVLDRILDDGRLSNFHIDALSLKAAALRKKALQGFQPPSADAVVNLLDHNRIATVEDLRALLLEELASYETWLRHAETDPLDVFWPGGKRLDENTARNRIVDDIAGRMASRNLSVSIEHHMADSNRCDMTAAAMIDGRRRLLVVEVKGQWHSELYSAAVAQLHERYSTHPDAEMQGIYLILWFGGGETIAGRRDPSISTPEELYERVYQAMPVELRGPINIFVLDLSLR